MSAAPLAAALLQAAPLTVGQVEAVGDRSALPLARQVLPAAIRDRVVEGRVGPVWSPFPEWQLTFREPARVVARDLCERGVHGIAASLPTARGKPSPETVLTLGAVRSWTEAAVLPAAARATAATCATARYVPVADDPARQVASYRMLLAAMAAAREKGPLPFAVTCAAENATDCADARAALATLPLDALAGVSARCLESEKLRERYRETNIYTVRCPPMRPGQPYAVEVSFGMSGRNGQSWRVGFVHRAGWPETIALSRSAIVYH